MGCGCAGRSEEGVDCPLDPNVELLGVESVDAVFSKAGTLIESLEKIRVAVVDNRDDLIIKTGACAHAKPDFLQVFKSYLWKLSTDNGGDFAKCDFVWTYEKPYFKMSPKQSADNLKILETLAHYVSELFSLVEEGKTVSETLMGVKDEISSNSDQYAEDINAKYTDDPFSIPGAISKMKKNIDKVKAACENAGKITTELSSTIAMFKDLGALLNKDGMPKINENGKKAVAAKLTKAHDITFFVLSDNEKFGKKSEEGLKRYTEKEESKKKMKEEIKSHKK